MLTQVIDRTIQKRFAFITSSYCIKFSIFQDVVHGVREAQMAHYNYILVVGDDEVQTGKLSGHKHLSCPSTIVSVIENKLCIWASGLV
ncbi:putative anticodon-binding protein [Rosa chinensis]|uniref:Putative anticodon-binding protein n=1 Tax=Rosa chinensis TaxID=74649 RepID=A0A2P6R453_ROSCH|nr:putative anticodon-binding protein [Rosa chinensis]